MIALAITTAGIVMIYWAIRRLRLTTILLILTSGALALIEILKL